MIILLNWWSDLIYNKLKQAKHAKRLSIATSINDQQEIQIWKR